MNRLGLTPRRGDGWARRAMVFKPGYPSLLMSHFVGSESAGRPAQRAPDRALRAHSAPAFPAFPAASPIRPASSWRAPITISYGPAMRSTAAIRRRAETNPMAPWCGWRRRILQVRTIGAGETVGYHAHLDGARPRRAGDRRGRLCRWLSRRSCVQRYNDERCRGDRRRRALPLAGRISMDTIVLDITLPCGCCRSAVRWSTLLDDDITVDELAARAGTIGYEVLTSLGRRTQRRITGAEMAKRALTYVCQNCGAVHGRWQGRCEACGEWNTLSRKRLPAAARRRPAPRPRGQGRVFQLEGLPARAQEAPRMPSGIAELDRVTGGGFVHGLGDAARRRSRHRQVDAADAGLRRLASQGHRVVYISGEEAIGQVRLRAERLAFAGAGRTRRGDERRGHHRHAVARRAAAPRHDRFDPDHVDRAVEAAPGTVTQVRGSAQALIRYAKTSGAARHPCRPRHQGRPDRRPPRGRAHGRCGRLVRGRRRATISASCAR